MSEHTSNETGTDTGNETGTDTGNEETTRIGQEDTTVLGTWQQPVAEDEREDRCGFHPLQTGYLVIGLLAVGAALLWLLMDQGVVEVGDGGVAWSVVLVVAGAVGLIASLGRGLRRR